MQAGTNDRLKNKEVPVPDSIREISGHWGGVFILPLERLPFWGVAAWWLGKRKGQQLEEYKREE